MDIAQIMPIPMPLFPLPFRIAPFRFVYSLNWGASFGLYLKTIFMPSHEKSLYSSFLLYDVAIPILFSAQNVLKNLLAIC